MDNSSSAAPALDFSSPQAECLAAPAPAMAQVFELLPEYEIREDDPPRIGATRRVIQRIRQLAQKR